MSQPRKPRGTPTSGEWTTAPREDSMRSLTRDDAVMMQLNPIPTIVPDDSPIEGHQMCNTSAATLHKMGDILETTKGLRKLVSHPKFPDKRDRALAILSRDRQTSGFAYSLNDANEDSLSKEEWEMVGEEISSNIDLREYPALGVVRAGIEGRNLVVELGDGTVVTVSEPTYHAFACELDRRRALADHVDTEPHRFDDISYSLDEAVANAHYDGNNVVSYTMTDSFGYKVVWTTQHSNLNEAVEAASEVSKFSNGKVASHIHAAENPAE